jgi:hypothetical protein
MEEQPKHRFKQTSSFPSSALPRFNRFRAIVPASKKEGITLPRFLERKTIENIGVACLVATPTLREPREPTYFDDAKPVF